MRWYPLGRTAGVTSAIVLTLVSLVTAAQAQKKPDWPKYSIDAWWPRSTQAERQQVQRALSTASCFPSGTPAANPTTGYPTADGSFGNATSFSHQALQTFISLKYPGVTTPPVRGTRFLNAINAVPVGYCGQTSIIGDDFPPRTCDRRIAERIWLKSRPELQQLRTSLSSVSSKITQSKNVFKTDAIGLLRKQREDEDTTRQLATKDLFEGTDQRLKSLIETNALLDNPSCAKCLRFSQLIALLEVADATGGKLNLSGKPAAKIDVNLVDEAFLKNGSDNVDRIRGYVAEIRRNPLNSSTVRDKLRAEVDVIVTFFLKHTRSSPLKRLLKDYTCFNFDGFDAEGKAPAKYR